MMENYWKNKKVLVTGACGTVGKELINQLIDYPITEIIGIDNNESELFFINEKFKDEAKVNFFLVDIKNKEQLRNFFTGIDIVLHCAARKHVILNEMSPIEAVQTNIIGTQNIIDAALENKVERVIFTSSDKAVNPTNVMGTSKLMGERLMTAANAATRGKNPIFASTRFGNVLGSNGSVIPIFNRQIEKGGPVTLTDPNMSRFVMTIPQAAELVLQSVPLAIGGEVFVTKMPIFRIEDLAKAMISIAKDRNQIDRDIQIEVIGTKPGEKLYEELINDEEVRRTIELDKFYAVIPAFKNIYSTSDYDYGKESKEVNKIYRSDLEKSMSTNEIKDYLIQNELI